MARGNPEAGEDLLRAKLPPPRVGGNAGAGRRQVPAGERPGDRARQFGLVARHGQPARGLPQGPIPDGDTVRGGGGTELALHEEIVIARDREPRCAQAGGREGALGPVEEPRPAGRVEGRTVVERIGVVGGLDALVARGARVGVHAAAAQDPEREVELVRLVVVDEVAALDHRLRMQRVHRAHRAREHLRAQRLLGPERRLEGLAEAIEERQAGG